ncbi:MAG TPA: DUF3883 domain-containing protein [Bacteroidetes bacterium]|nr:DUF3883 domain-containing protein [Bacteroidota bacterium]
MGVYFMAAGSENRTRTLDRGWAVDDVVRVVPEHEAKLRAAYPEGHGVYAWGATDGSLHQLSRVQEGDYVVDVNGPDIVQVFSFEFWTTSPELRRLFGWEPGGNGNEYEHAYFLSHRQPTSRRRKAEFQHAFGFRNSHWLAGQRYFDDDVIAEAMERTGALSIEEFLGLRETPSYDGGAESAETGEPAETYRLAAPEGAAAPEPDDAVPTTGQGRGLTGPERRAVERRAMDLAAAHYRGKGYEVEDVGATESYDLRCHRRRSEDRVEELRVEVKGTTGGGGSVLLTFNEVKHAKSRQTRVALFVVSHIQLEGRGTDSPRATGGEPRVLDPWDAREGTLSVETYRYTLPGRG